ncbi:MAG: zinc ABC transporter substrate-binding protein [Actinobacteria bacterium]|nr:zinc ABC transporter substrate-binding protein [Actinomycetota bacterium]
MQRRFPHGRPSLPQGLPVAVVVLAVLAAGCGPVSSVSQAAPRRTAVTTISVLADFTRAVAGDLVQVRSLVGVGADPHVYEPVPSDAAAVAEADIVVRNGLGLEVWLDPFIGASTPGRPVVTATDGLEPLPWKGVGHAGDPDPHMWMDPVLAADYVRGIRDGLAERWPRHSETFDRNAGRYLARLRGLNRRIAGRVATIPPASRRLVTTHDAFRYFGRRYGLAVVGTIWSVSTEREPSAHEVRRLVDAVEARGVPTVFVETTINPELMHQVARDAGVGVGRPLYGDSLGAPGSGADTYLGMMAADARRIAAGLGGRARP